ncbi:AAA family ATPase [Micrococcus lylae]|uniref:AAA family ATPase n=1 Tax=Micrococcus lylae TaxID=1273 RepID=UPI000C7FD638|nr:SMC family ATPase [Micrococcus lylae]WIK82642.1 SMC family ATPase [Micrococcus lylae]
MRIHRIRLTGIGPYAETQDVDFEALNSAGLFLLDGPTGAGKSTILTALCYALYGSVPGGRSPDSLVTTLRPAGTVAPEVLVEFTVQTRRFEVLRSPRHARPKKRGKGTTMTPASVSLRELKDGAWTAPLTRADEVGQQIASVMHLDAEQFMQVVMLPQGQFARFLTATSDERRDLLRRLFGTQRFDGVEEHLKAEADRLDSRAAADRQIAQSAREQLREAAREELGQDWHDPAPYPEDDDDLLTLVAERADAAHAAAKTRQDEAEAAEKAARTALEQLRRTGQALEAAAGWAVRDEDHRSKAEATAADRTAVEAHRRAEAVVTAAARAEKAAGAAESAAAQEEAARERAEADATAAGWLAAARAEQGEVQQGEQAEARETVQEERARKAVRSAVQAGASAAEAVAAALKDRIRIGRLQEQQAAAAQRREAIVGERRTAETERDARAEEVAALREEVEAGAAKLGAQDAVDAELAAARARLKAAETAAARAAELETAEAAHTQARQAEEKAAQRRLDLLRSRYEQAASELAAQLEDGHPCLVCGSVEHPRPADPVDEDVTEAAVQRAEKALEKASAATGAAAADVTAAQARLHEARTAAGGLGVDEASEAVSAAEAAKEELAAAKRALAATRRRLTTAQTKQESVAALLAEVATEDGKLEEQSAQRAERIADLEESVAAAAGEGGDLEARRDAVVAARSLLESLDEALGRRASAGALAAQAEDALRSALAEKDFADVAAARAARLSPEDAAAKEAAVQAYAREESALAELAATALVAEGRRLRAEGTQAPDEAQTAAAVERLQAAEAASREQGAVVGSRAALVSAVRRQSAVLREVLGRAADLIAEHERVTGLLALVRGSGENRLKMPLTSYVLAGRLEEVAAAASERLRKMTDDRYCLEYSDAVGGRGNKGLEIVVRDHYVDEVRHPSTLSGGETFMASLSLALGLADTVQAASGGIELDTLFVDEGFGSLDTETLDEVMGVVDSLRTGGRTVGLVSHVERMKNDIPTRLAVTKHRRGSSLAVHDGD